MRIILGLDKVTGYKPLILISVNLRMAKFCLDVFYLWNRLQEPQPLKLTKMVLAGLPVLCSKGVHVRNPSSIEANRGLDSLHILNNVYGQQSSSSQMMK